MVVDEVCISVGGRRLTVDDVWVSEGGCLQNKY